MILYRFMSRTEQEHEPSFEDEANGAWASNVVETTMPTNSNKRFFIDKSWDSVIRFTEKLGPRQQTHNFVPTEGG